MGEKMSVKTMCGESYKCAGRSGLRAKVPSAGNIKKGNET